MSDSNTPTVRHRIHIEFADELDGKAYFDDWPTNQHPDATEAECAEQVRQYVKEHGLDRFISDWCLDEFDVWVGRTQVVVGGRLA